MISLIASLISVQLAHMRLEVVLPPEHNNSAYLSRITDGIAVIDSHDASTNTYTITLTGSMKPSAAMDKLSPKVKRIRFDDFLHNERPMDRHSVRDMQRYGDRLEALMAKGVDVDVNEERLESLGMIKHRLEKRAFPYDTYDRTAYIKAAQQRQGMPPKPNVTDSPDGYWSFQGPRNLNNIGGSATTYKVAGRVSAVAFSPTSPFSTFFIGGANGGVWKTTNGGSSWTPLTDDWPYLQVSDIKIDPNDANRIFVACGDAHAEEGYGLGIMRSLDGGQTWQEVGEETLNGAIPEVIAIDPDNTDFIHVAAADGLYRSTNGGNTWIKVSTISGRVFDIEIGDLTNTNNRYYYAAGENGKIYKSTSRGASFSLALNNSSYGHIRALACSPIDDGNVYAICDDRQVLRSTDAGQSWDTGLTTGFPHHRVPANNDFKQWSQVDFDYQMVCSSRTSLGFQFDVVYVGLFDLSMYAASNWYELGGTLTLQPDPQIHCDHHDMEIDPTNPNRSLVGSDGGVYLMTRNGDNTVTVTNLNAALYIAELWHMNGHPTSTLTMLGGIQHQGSAFSDGPVTDWDMANRGDGAYTAISSQDGNKQFTSIQNYSYDSGFAYLSRTLNGWATSDVVSLYIGGAPAFIPPIAMDPSNGNHLYIGGTSISRWNDSGVSGSTVDDILGNKVFSSKMTSIAVAKTDSNRIYVGLSNGEVWRSSDYGETWTKISNSGLPTARVESISVSLTNSSNISVTLGGVGVGHGHVYRCLNTTATTPSWEERSGSGSTALPDLPFNTLCRDPNTNDWYAGGEAGCFWSDDFGATWYEMTNTFNLPNVEVTMLHAPGNGYLYASTFGRGIWRMKLNSAESGISSVSLADSSIIGGPTVIGTVTLDQVAPPGGAAVSLSSSDPGVIVPSSVTVQGGDFSANFNANTEPVVTTRTVTITATRNAVNRTTTIQIVTPSVTNLSGPVSVVNGSTASFTVSMNGAAPSGGATINLSSSNPAALQVPATTSIGVGQFARMFTATTSNVAADTNVTVTASRNGGSDTATTTVQHYGLSSLTTSPTGLYSGDDYTGTVTIDRAAPANGVTVILTTTSGTIPSFAFVSTGQTATTFAGTAPVVAVNTTMTLQATLGTATVTRNVPVRPAFLQSVSVTPTSIPGGHAGQGTVTLRGKAPAGGLVVRLRLVRPTGLALTSPQSVTVLADQNAVNFTIGTSPVSTAKGCALWALYNGDTVNAQFKVVP